MARYFKDITSAIKQALFPLIVPEGYVPHLPAIYLLPDAPEMIHVPNEYDRVQVNYPITYIVDMYDSKVDFQFVNSNDVYEVHRLLEMYLMEFAGNQAALNDPATKLFIDRARNTYHAFHRRVSVRKRAKEVQEPMSMAEALASLAGRR